MFTLYLVVTEEKRLNTVFRLTLILCDTSMDHHQTDFSTLQSGLSVMLRSEKEGGGRGGGKGGGSGRNLADLSLNQDEPS